MSDTKRHNLRKAAPAITIVAALLILGGAYVSRSCRPTSEDGNEVDAVSEVRAQADEKFPAAPDFPVDPMAATVERLRRLNEGGDYAVLLIKKPDGTPYANQKVVFTLRVGARHTDRTDANGILVLGAPKNRTEREYIPRHGTRTGSIEGIEHVSIRAEGYAPLEGCLLRGGATLRRRIGNTYLHDVSLSAGATIRIQFVGAEDRPVPDVLCWYMQLTSRSCWHTLRSDARGMASIRDLSPDQNLVLRAKAGGYGPIERKIVPEEFKDIVKACLPDGLTLNVGVKLGDGTPLPEVTVVPRRTRAPRAFPRLGQGPAKSSADGIAVLRDLSPGTYRISGRREDCMVSTATVTVDVEADGRTVWLEAVQKTSTLTGRVVDQTGAPVRGLELKFHKGFLNSGPGGSEATTDADGRFSIKRFPGHKLNVWLKDRLSEYEFAAPSRLTVSIPADTREIRIPMVRRFVLRGRVLDRNGHAVDDIVIDERGGGLTSRWSPIGRKRDADGWFTCVFSYRDIEKGSIELVVRGPDNTVSDLIRPSGQMTDPVTLRLKPAPQVRLRVLDRGGRPLEGLKVSAVDRRLATSEVYSIANSVIGNMYTAGSATDDDGVAVINARTLNELLILVTADNYAQKGLFLCPAAPPESVEVRMTEGGTVRGTVKRVKGMPRNSPIAAFLRDEKNPNYTFTKAARVGPDGGYSLSLLPPGSYRLLMIKSLNTSPLFSRSNIVKGAPTGQVEIAEGQTVVHDLEVATEPLEVF